jgi:hypothetical protein
MHDRQNAGALVAIRHSLSMSLPRQSESSDLVEL